LTQGAIVFADGVFNTWVKIFHAALVTSAGSLAIKISSRQQISKAARKQCFGPSVPIEKSNANPIHNNSSSGTGT
jgi:hypothetical protein